MSWLWKKAVAVTLAGLVLVLGVKFLHCPYYGRRLAQQLLLKKDAAGPGVDFKVFMAYTAFPPKESKESSLIDGYVYQSSDCVEVSSEFYSFALSGGAEQEIERRLRSDYRVLEHTTKADATGAGVMERAVTQAEVGGDYFILRRRENKINAIISESLPYALEYERRLAK